MTLPDGVTHGECEAMIFRLRQLGESRAASVIRSLIYPERQSPGCPTCFDQGSLPALDKNCERSHGPGQIDDISGMTFYSCPDCQQDAAISDLIARFSVALLEKLKASEAKYGWQNGWLKDDWANDLRHEIRRHIEKGDPRDVAAYCAFAWHHGWTLCLTTPENKSYDIVRESVANAKTEVESWPDWKRPAGMASSPGGSGG
jgi:hypothetical protein